MHIEKYIPNNAKVLFVRGIDDKYVYERAEVGIDGNCGYALLGPNIQEGESEFVEIKHNDDPNIDAERQAWFEALCRLRMRLGGYFLYFIKSQ